MVGLIEEAREAVPGARPDFELHTGRIARLVAAGRLTELEGRETLRALEAIRESGAPGAGGLHALSRSSPFSLEALNRAQLLTGAISSEEYARPLRTSLAQAGAFAGLLYGGAMACAFAGVALPTGRGAVEHGPRGRRRERAPATSR